MISNFKAQISKRPRARRIEKFPVIVEILDPAYPNMSGVAGKFVFEHVAHDFAREHLDYVRTGQIGREGWIRVKDGRTGKVKIFGDLSLVRRAA